MLQIILFDFDYDSFTPQSTWFPSLYILRMHIKSLPKIMMQKYISYIYIWIYIYIYIYIYLLISNNNYKSQFDENKRQLWYSLFQLVGWVHNINQLS